jgi:hypothetical protein
MEYVQIEQKSTLVNILTAQRLQLKGKLWARKSNPKNRKLENDIANENSEKLKMIY